MIVEFSEQQPMQTHISLVIGVLLFLPLATFSQVKLVLQGEPIQQVTVEKLWKFQVVNSASSSQTLSIRTTLEQSGTILYQGIVPEITIGSGVSIFPNSQLLSLIQGNSLLGNLQTGQNEVMSVCYELISLEGKVLDQSCRTFLPPMIIPPHLVYPFHQEELEIEHPVFSWTPPLPYSGRDMVHYQVKVVEIHPGQTPEVAIRQNLAFFQANNYSTNILPYPTSARRFDKNSSYAWQVSAYTNRVFSGNTEVWEFSFKQEEEERSLHVPFADLESWPSGGNYIAQEAIGFKYRQRYSDESVAIKIIGRNGKLIKLNQGQLERKNKHMYILHLPLGGALKPGERYVLEVTDDQNKQHTLPFLYHASSVMR